MVHAAAASRARAPPDGSGRGLRRLEIAPLTSFMRARTRNVRSIASR